MKYKANFTIDEFKQMVLEFKPDCKASSFNNIRKLIITIYGLVDTSQIAKLDAAIALHKISGINYLNYVTKKYNLKLRDRFMYSVSYIFELNDVIELSILINKLYIELIEAEGDINNMHVKLINAIEGFRSGTVTIEELKALDLEHQAFNMNGGLTYEDFIMVYVDRAIRQLLKVHLDSSTLDSVGSRAVFYANTDAILSALDNNVNDAARFLDKFNELLTKYKAKEL